MDYSYLLNNGSLSNDLLLKEGFILNNNLYLKRYNIEKNFYIEINISKKIIVKVFDILTNEEYYPIYVVNNNGEFTKKLKSTIDEVVKTIINSCLIKNNVKENLIQYVEKKYHTKMTMPWENNPTFITLNTNNTHKWYGLIMDINANLLKLNGDIKVDVINIKLPQDIIPKLIDNINYFPAYHMNKKYWITILLNNNLDINKLYNLIDESYELVDKN